MKPETKSACWRPWAAGLAAYLLATAVTRVLEPQVVPLARSIASLVRAVLEGFGIAVVQSGPILQHPGGFSCEVAAECLGLAPVVALAAMLWTDRSLTRPRLTGALLIGGSLLLALNFVRLVSLFWLGTLGDGVFRLAHDLLWPLALIAAFLAIALRARGARPAVPARRLGPVAQAP